MRTDLAELFERADGAHPAAVDELFALLYDELHRLAGRHLRRGGSSLTLGSTTLVHEAYLNMADRGGLAFADRARFFAYASRAMRGLMLNYAKRCGAKKRGRQFEVTLAEGDGVAADGDDAGSELDGLGEALDRLGTIDPALAELVDLHFFGGLTFVEIAELRGVSERTVQRDWRKARLLLHLAITGDGSVT